MNLTQTTHAAEFMMLLDRKKLHELAGTPLYKKAKAFLDAEKDLLKLLELSGRGVLKQEETNEPIT